MRIHILPFLLLLFSIISISKAFAHDISMSEKELLSIGTNSEFIYIGLTHMLTGYDHVLFVLGILLFVSSFKQMIKLITVFTLGHSISLILATYNSFEVNYYLIDAIIGLSVTYIAFINLEFFQKFFKINPHNTILVIFLFGLIHGLGLSTRLQQLPLNLEELFLNIISFNVGIELGQIIVLILMFVLITFIKKTQFLNSFKLFLNIVLLFAGVIFFVIQIIEYKNINSSKMPSTVVDWQDSISITIKAHSDKEYKLWIEKDKKVFYSWHTNSKKLYFDFHGEPASDVTGYFKSYKEAISSSDTGDLVVPFIGTHGWYWKNTTSKDIIVNLKIKGEYILSDVK